MSAFERLGIDSSFKLEKKKLKYSSTQENTKDTFGFKWARRDTYESEVFQEAIRNWLFERYCDDDPNKLKFWLSGGRKIVLDAGCGPGHSAILFFGDHLRNCDYLGVDISDAVNIAEDRFKEHGYPGDFLQLDILDLPISNESVDIIFAEGVLHHTDSTEKAIKYLSTKLKKGGRFLFYVYAKKAIIREFTDDYIREQLMDLSDEEAWEALKPLTMLGKALGELELEIDVPMDIPYLGIKAGRTDIQRFFYWNICKLYYRPEFNIEDMNHINFDWFLPLNCHRHTKEEIISYCSQSNLIIENLNEQQSGFTVVAVKE